MRILERLVPRDVIGFCYHTVSDRPMPHVESLYRCKSAAQFTRDLEFLQRHYRVVEYRDLDAARRALQPAKPCVVITFDDGLAECHDIVRPILLERGVPAIFFVTTEFLDNRRLFYRQKVALCIESYSRLSPSAASAARTSVGSIFGSSLDSSPQLVARLQRAEWSEEPAIDATCALLEVDTDAFLRTVRPYLTVAQLRTLAADGFTIGAHGTSHQRLGAMPAPDARAEIVAACAGVSELVGAGMVPFAFPFNGKGVDREMLAALRDACATTGLFFDSRELKPDRAFVINRLVVDDPAGATPATSNLPARLRRAYAREIIRPLATRFARYRA